MMNYKEAFLTLQSMRQEHLLSAWDELTVPQRTKLLDEIASIDLPLLKEQQAFIYSSKSPSFTSFSPLNDADYSLSGSMEDKKRGLELLSKGKVGCLLIAGGQGTRLGFNGPKGAYPVSNICHKSLFQLFAEKTDAASRYVGFKLPLAIMTSPLNDEETKRFFEQNTYFGIENQLSFFTQNTLPFLDANANLFLEKCDTVAHGPDGNGEALHRFYQSPIWKKWQEIGITRVLFVLVDNALADPFDAELVGFHERTSVDVTIKSTRRKIKSEKVGVLVKENNKIVVKEYFELNTQEKDATLQNGELKHSLANLSLFCFSMDFIEKVSQSRMPLHKDLKSAQVSSETIKAWKFEKFIFDVLPDAKSCKVLVFPREECFSPLKNPTGDNSLETVQKDLRERDFEIYKKITGRSPPHSNFELSQDFYYPQEELIKKWKGKEFPNTSYIIAN